MVGGSGSSKGQKHFRQLVSKANHVEAKFAQRRFTDISKSELELWQARLLKQGPAPKTVNDIFTIVRGIWADAFADGVIKTNPLDRITNIQIDADSETADPFSHEALALIADAYPEREKDARMIPFNSWTGLSLSELIALAREDVDLVNGRVSIRRALVSGQFKVPKERSRILVVELIKPALELLRQLMADSTDYASEEIEIVQRDNITKRKERLHFLFRSSTSVLLWSGKTISNWFTAHLVKAEVRHRGANQCRHTFASQALSRYVPVEWVARQLGHSDTTMVKKHYGRWIPADTKSIAAVVSEMMGFVANPSAK
ncbi:tyrosine-type recombinase/integrase [Pseudomonas sp. NPDC090201]|uniref:tyrosine-type recombinase/integrase n=1 Tax=Pseudomonas sp. NPDC090201 TaxID=3364475 RepID=UPI0037F14537